MSSIINYTLHFVPTEIKYKIKYILDSPEIKYYFSYFNFNFVDFSSIEMRSACVLISKQFLKLKFIVSQQLHVLNIVIENYSSSPVPVRRRCVREMRTTADLRIC